MRSTTIKSGKPRKINNTKEEGKPSSFLRGVCGEFGYASMVT